MDNEPSQQLAAMSVHTQELGRYWVGQQAGRGEGIPLPEDLLVEVLMRLSWMGVGQMARTCRKLRALAGDDKLWQRLALTGLGAACVRLTSSTEWRRTCMELTTLKHMRWERKPRQLRSSTQLQSHNAGGDMAQAHQRPPAGSVWPRARWGHTVTVLDRHTLMVFGGEGAGATNDVHLYNCRAHEWRLMRCAPAMHASTWARYTHIHTHTHTQVCWALSARAFRARVRAARTGRSRLRRVGRP